MSVFGNLTKKVSNTAKVAAKKSSDVIEVTKLNMHIGSEDDKIQKEYTQIGKLLYELYKNGEEVNETLRAHCETIKSHEENIKAMKQKMLVLKNLKICPGCDAELEAEIAFCPKCGTKQEIPQAKAQSETQPKPTGSVCSGCGTPYEPGTAFCQKCGAKLN